MNDLNQTSKEQQDAETTAILLAKKRREDDLSVEYGLVSYAGDNECIVCRPRQEYKVLLDYFVLGGRKTEDYIRYVTDKELLVTIPSIRVEG